MEVQITKDNTNPSANSNAFESNESKRSPPRVPNNSNKLGDNSENKSLNRKRKSSQNGIGTNDNGPPCKRMRLLDNNNHDHDTDLLFNESEYVATEGRSFFGPPSYETIGE